MAVIVEMALWDTLLKFCERGSRQFGRRRKIRFGAREIFGRSHKIERRLRQRLRAIDHGFVALG